ncbi:MAG: DUF2279 domain-containing protein [Candidatus Kapaibacterium sp.]
MEIREAQKKYCLYFIVVFLTFLNISNPLAQEKNVNVPSDSVRVLPAPITPSINRDSNISLTRVGVSAGLLAGAITALHIYQNNAWWANDRGKFHVIEDPSYQADFDKAGHTFGAYYSSHFFDEAFQWTGMDSGQATAFGALSGAIWEYYVEIEDGFANAWGFSRGDAKADLAGATFYLLRNRISFLRNFNYKWSYVPTDKLLKNQPDIPGQSVNFIEDYGGQSYYLTMDIHAMLPKNVQQYWPSWLNLAIGVGGYNINSVNTDTRLGDAFIYRKKAWYISLDYDIEKIFPESDIPFLNFLRRSFNYWHFPAPAYRLYPDPRFFILFPFQMTIGR